MAPLDFRGGSAGTPVFTRSAWLVWLIAGGLAFVPASSQAAGTVTNCSQANLIAAMAGGGTVTLACNGTITLTSPLTNATDTLIDGTGHQVILSGSNQVQVISVRGSTRLALVHLTIADGAAAIGAGLLNCNGSVYATNCVFVNNSAWSEGGGIFNQGTMVLELCLVTNNQAVGGSGFGAGMDAAGGAIYNAGTLGVQRTTLASNRAAGGMGGWTGYVGTNGGNGYGGAIYNQGNLWLEACTLAGNSTLGGNGGPGAPGIPMGRGAADGVAGGNGGQGFGCLDNVGTATIINSTFVANAVGGGGGGSGGAGGTGELAGGNGGNGGNGNSGYGVIAGGGPVFLTNCTLASNIGINGAAGTAGGAGGHLQPGGTSGSPGSAGAPGFGSIGGIYASCCYLVNTLLGGSSGNCGGRVIDGGYNLSSDGSCGFTAPGSRNEIDPMLASPADNGGPTATMAFSPNSPALNAGSAVGAPGTDQRGVHRPQGPGVDIGAFEFQYPRFDAAVVAAGTNCWLQMTGLELGQAFLIQASSNLLNWSTITNFAVPTNGCFEYDDPRPMTAGPRFYRLQLLLGN